jgi:hypothetical protein
LVTPTPTVYAVLAAQAGGAARAKVTVPVLTGLAEEFTKLAEADSFPDENVGVENDENVHDTRVVLPAARAVSGVVGIVPA